RAIRGGSANGFAPGGEGRWNPGLFVYAPLELDRAASPRKDRVRPLYRPFDHDVFDLADRRGGIQAFRTYVDAAHDRVAADQSIRIFQVVEPRVQRLIATVGNESIRP